MIVDPNELVDYARAVDVCADAVTAADSAITQRLDGASWAGSGADAFRARAADLDRLVARDVDALRGTSAALRALAAQLSDAIDDLRSIEMDVTAWLASHPPGAGFPSPWPANDLPPSGDPRWRDVQQAFQAAGISVGHHALPSAPPVDPTTMAARTETVLGLPVTPAEKWIIDHEDSSYNTAAQNPHSTAFGLGQLIEAQRKHYLGADMNSTDPAKQLEAFRGYVKDRYGTAERAVEWWKTHNWY